MAQGRERWHSRTAFIMAAVGSAIGLGNVWRFPGTAFNYGGGAFFVPYFIALLTAGIPLMIVEYGLGTRFQGSAAKSYGKLGKRYEWVGWWAVLVGLVISIYYSVILAWSWNYCGQSLAGLFGGGLPWEPDQAASFFQRDVARLSADETRAGFFNWWTVLGLLLTWVVVYLAIVKGVLRVGKIVMITVPLPLVLLVILAVRGLTLDGATDGLAYYLSPDWARLADPDTWVAAYGQVFFSLSVGWGILIAYSSYMPRGSDVVNNAYITSFANCGFSFLAGFAVFSTLGYLGVALNTPIGDLKATSFDLAFTSYPTAIENIPMAPALQCLLAFAFFLMLLTLGVDSAFSIVEAVATAMYDKFRMARERLVRLLCIGGFGAGLIYCFGGGLYWLDITDKFMCDYGLTFVALVQAVVIGWIIPREKFDALMEDINRRSELKIGTIWKLSIRFVTPLVLGYILIASVVGIVQDGYGDYEPAMLALFGLGPTLMVLVMARVFSNMKGKGDEA